MDKQVKILIDKLNYNKILSKEEFEVILSHNTPEIRAYAAGIAVDIKKSVYGDDIYIRGLIEFSNYCKNDCYYCGIRCSNTNADRYRLTEDEILECARRGYELGFRTIVLQSGEDPYYNDDRICSIISRIKAELDVAITLSIGEKSEESYRRYKEAGADRYLLRHETYNNEHYSRLHPANLSGEHRKECLKTLKNLGYQVGAGFMVGSPYQTVSNLAEDLIYLKELNPHMVGIGPFIAHHDTPFADMANGTLEDTLLLLSLIRIMIPDVLLPATTALGTINPTGREQGINAGANVVMPNLSPITVRKKYDLYDSKICTGEEAAECVECLKKRVLATGNYIVIDRGDSRRD